MIELKEPRAAASPESLAEAEARLAAIGTRIPPSYWAFLAEQDGGRPVKNVFDVDEVDFSNLYEIAPDLQTFLDGLSEAPPLDFEPEVLSTAKGWRRLFSRR